MAALEKVAGSIPDYAPQMTAETISAERKRHTQLRDEKLRRHRDRG